MSTAACAQAAVFAGQLADAARVLARRYFRAPLAVRRKADSSPVTRADREIEQRLRAMIARRFPEHGVFGEEAGGDLARPLTWVLDPIDGTKSFICGHPLFGTLIALLQHGRPVLGVIDMPMLDERWVGQGAQCLLNGVRARSSACRRLARARLFVTAPEQFAASHAQAFERLRSQVQLCRYGGDCHSYGLLASGHVDLVLEAGLQAHDVLALVPVVQGAGGTITDWSGAALTPAFDGRVLAAANSGLHQRALERLHGRG